MRNSTCILAKRSGFARRSQPGFTLLELSIVLAVVALVVGMGMSAGPAMLESARRAQTEKKLDQIEAALAAFSDVNRRLPCPADVSLPESDANFGMESANKGICTGGTPAATFTDSTNKVVEGGVPVQKLGLPHEFAYDGWGNRIAYAVSRKYAEDHSFTHYNFKDPKCGRITVKDAAAGNRTTNAAYSLASYGPNGHGGYLKTGARMSVGSTNSDEQTNCHCDSSAAATAYTAVYVQKLPSQNPANATDSFDDLVRFKERWQMQNWEDGQMERWDGMCILGFRADGEGGNHQSGSAVASGDINGDGITDLIIGAYRANSNRGYTYVVFGTESGFPNPLPLSSLDGSNGFRIEGTVTGYSGYAVAAGDINGDGYDEIIIGAYNENGGHGSTYIIFGKPAGWSATQSLATGVGNLIDGTQGFRLDGVGGGSSYDRSGYAVQSGDVNGDGKDDIIVGAYGWRCCPNTGAAYVVFGKTGAWSSTMSLSSLNGTNGARLTGVNYNDGTAGALAVGDINDDGIQDIMIPTTNTAPLYIVFGKTGAWPSTMSLSTLNGINGFQVTGMLSSGIGNSPLLATGDINGDGITDIVKGTGYMTGQVYVIFGKSSWSSPVDAATLDGSNGFRLDGVAPSFGVGHSVSAGDINGDSIDDIIIGTKSSNDIVYTVFGKPSGWAATQTLATGSGNLIDGTQGIRLDRSSAGWETSWSGFVSAGDINGDGTKDMIIGVGGADYGISNSGSTFVVYGKRIGWQETDSLNSLIE